MRRREVMQGSEIGALGFHGKENALDNGSRGVSLWSPLAETAFESLRSKYSRRVTERSG